MLANAPVEHEDTLSLYQYLSQEDELEKADLIIAFGAKSDLRAHKAIELYKQGYADKILFTGGSPNYSKSKPEAVRYKDMAMLMGVPDDAIIIEQESITLADNIRSSIQLLNDHNIHFRKVILVNSPYSQLRGYATWMKFVPEDYKALRVNTGTKAGLRDNDWYTNQEGIIYIMSEYYKHWFGLVINTC